MALPRMRIANHDKMGELIKKWARYPGERPGSVGDFLDQANAAGAGVELDPGFESIAFSEQPPANVLHVQLPDVSVLDAMEGDPDPANPFYDLPEFYDQAYNGGADARRPMSGNERLNFQLARLGDYCTQKCH